MFDRPSGGERALLVRIGLGGPVEQEDLDEFSQLAESAGALPVRTLTGRRERPEPKFFVGSGKADEIRAAVDECDAEVVLVDHALSPSQERNLEKLVCRRVLDRNALILDIFAQRARSHEGKLQVELAQLKHLATRLVRGWTHLERQKGGIGLRGPGETQLETDRRLLGERVKVLSRRLEKLQQQRETGRQRRVEIPIPSVALVGYTNAGKSTLFRSLTGADAYVADQLFATLDPLVRRVLLPGGSPIVVADIDASDPRRDERIDQVDAVLREVGAGDIPQIRVFNKIDRLELAPRIERDADGMARSAWVSAAHKLGLDALMQAVAERLSVFARRVRVRVDPRRAGALRARLFAAGAVREETVGADGTLELIAEIPEAQQAELARMAGVEVIELQAAAQTCVSADGYLQSPDDPRAP